MFKRPFGRQDRLLKQKRNDAYQCDFKFPDHTRCMNCAAVFQKGRWTWTNDVTKVHEIVCPACKRIADHYPAGEIEIRGTFFQKHRQEILNLINNTERMEKAHHPMERLMEIQDKREQLIVTTTGIHLARRIGENLSRSYKGSFSYQYGKGEKIIRGSWER